MKVPDTFKKRIEEENWLAFQKLKLKHLMNFRIIQNRVSINYFINFYYNCTNTNIIPVDLASGVIFMDRTSLFLDFRRK